MIDIDPKLHITMSISPFDTMIFFSFLWINMPNWSMTIRNRTIGQIFSIVKNWQSLFLLPCIIFCCTLQQPFYLFSSSCAATWATCNILTLSNVGWRYKEYVCSAMKYWIHWKWTARLTSFEFILKAVGLLNPRWCRLSRKTFQWSGVLLFCPEAACLSRCSTCDSRPLVHDT